MFNVRGNRYRLVTAIHFNRPWLATGQHAIRDIEQGKDVKLSNLQAVAAALGLELELVDAQTL